MPTNLYGPGDYYLPTNSHVLPALIRRFHEAAEANTPSVTWWGTGSPLREFLHVDDLGETCVFALEHWSPAPGEFTYLNVGTGVDLSIRELAEAVATATVGAMTFFISLELAGPNQFPGTERSTKSVRRKSFAISWAEFAYTLLLEAILSGFDNTSVEQAFSLDTNTCT